MSFASETAKPKTAKTANVFKIFALILNLAYNIIERTNESKGGKANEYYKGY